MHKFYKVTIALFLLASVWSTSVSAQDARFNQFYVAPQHLNPAMTGVFDGSFRINMNYRDQWSSVLGANPFRTAHVGMDFKFNSFGGDHFAIGINGLMDQAGQSNFNTTQFFLGGSYQKQVGGAAYTENSQYLIAGGQVGFGQRSFSPSGLWFSDQWDGAIGLPNQSIASSDQSVINASTDLYLDFNAGLLFYATFGDDASIYFGGALNHISEPQVSFLGGNVGLTSRWLVHMGGQIELTRELSILPGAMFQMQGTQMSTTVGTNFRYSNSDWREVAIRIGLWPHIANKLNKGVLMDEMAVNFTLEFNRWHFGISYGVNTSALNIITNSRGAYELSAIYVHPSKSRIKTKCPKF